MEWNWKEKFVPRIEHKQYYNAFKQVYLFKYIWSQETLAAIYRVKAAIVYDDLLI